MKYFNVILLRKMIRTIFFILLLPVCLHSQQLLDPVKWILPADYPRVRYLNDRFFNVHDTLKNSYIFDLENSKLIPTKYYMIEPVKRKDENQPIFYSAYVVDSTIEKVGYFLDRVGKVLLDENLNEVINQQIKRVKFCHGTFCIARLNGADIIIDTKAKKINKISTNLYASPDYYDSYFVASSGGINIPDITALVDYSGKITQKFPSGILILGGKNQTFFNFSTPKDGMISWGIVSRDGDIIVPEEKEEATSCNRKSYFTYHMDGKIAILMSENGVIDFSGEIFSFKQFSNKLTIAIDRGGKCGLVNADGIFKLPMEYEKIGYSDLGNLSAYNHYYGFGNKKGASIFFDRRLTNVRQTNFDEIGTSCKQFIAVNKDGKWGVMNTEGEKIIDCQFRSNPTSYYNFYVKENCPIMFLKLGKSFLIGAFEGDDITLFNDQGEKLKTLNFRRKKTSESITLFFDRKIPLLDEDWELPLWLNEFKLPKELLALIKIDEKEPLIFKGQRGEGRSGRLGLINSNEKWILEPSYESLWEFGDNMFLIKRNKRKGIIKVER